MFQTSGYNSRGFAAEVSPCVPKDPAPDGSGKARLVAAEYLRTGFHDMATADAGAGAGGVDASIAYEMENGENNGIAFPSTLAFLSGYLSAQSSLSDLIALGVYASVRACEGPAVPIRVGRIDAQNAGPLGVPMPQDSPAQLSADFQRMGFPDAADMIAMTVCGHTLGGVHASINPQIVPPGSNSRDAILFDNTHRFDARVAQDFVRGNTTNPLVVGPSVAQDLHSDFKIFSRDGNATVGRMSDEQNFADTCKDILQRMIDVVPHGVHLSDPIKPYDVKPVGVQLELEGSGDGAYLVFSGQVRVRKGAHPGFANIKSVKIRHRPRQAGSGCQERLVDAAHVGSGSGFDEAFEWFAFSTKVSLDESVSSFTVEVTTSDEEKTVVYDNYTGGAGDGGFRVDDSVIVQRSQSCFVPAEKHATVIVAVRRELVEAETAATETQTELPRRSVVLKVSGPVPLFAESPDELTWKVSKLVHHEVEMEPLESSTTPSAYLLFTASTVPPSSTSEEYTADQLAKARFNVAVADQSSPETAVVSAETFVLVGSLPGQCGAASGSGNGQVLSEGYCASGTESDGGNVVSLSTDGGEDNEPSLNESAATEGSEEVSVANADTVEVAVAAAAAATSFGRQDASTVTVTVITEVRRTLTTTLKKTTTTTSSAPVGGSDASRTVSRFTGASPRARNVSRPHASPVGAADEGA